MTAGQVSPASSFSIIPNPIILKLIVFFIQNMENDPKKRLVVSTIVNFAHFMGSLVLAEGVETRAEYAQCKTIGCDMIQGYFIQHPTRHMGDLKSRYPHIRELARQDRRSGRFKDRSLIANEIKYLKPVSADTDMITVVDLFEKRRRLTSFPW